MHWNSSLDMWQCWQTARAEAWQVIVTHLSLHYMLQQAWQINHWGERTRAGRSGWGETKTSKGSKEKIHLHQIQISSEALGVFFPLLGFYSSWLGESVSNLPVRRSCVCFCCCGKSCHQITAGRPQILLLLEEKLGKCFFFFLEFAWVTIYCCTSLRLYTFFTWLCCLKSQFDSGVLSICVTKYVLRSESMCCPVFFVNYLSFVGATGVF